MNYEHTQKNYTIPAKCVNTTDSLRLMLLFLHLNSYDFRAGYIFKCTISHKYMCKGKQKINSDFIHSFCFVSACSSQFYFEIYDVTMNHCWCLLFFFFFFACVSLMRIPISIRMFMQNSSLLTVCVNVLHWHKIHKKVYSDCKREMC